MVTLLFPNCKVTEKMVVFLLVRVIRVVLSAPDCHLRNGKWNSLSTARLFICPLCDGCSKLHFFFFSQKRFPTSFGMNGFYMPRFSDVTFKKLFNIVKHKQFQFSTIFYHLSVDRSSKYHWLKQLKWGVKKE